MCQRKIAVYHRKIAIYDRKIAVYYRKIAMYYRKIAVYDGKIAAYHVSPPHHSHHLPAPPTTMHSRDKNSRPIPGPFQGEGGVFLVAWGRIMEGDDSLTRRIPL